MCCDSRAAGRNDDPLLFVKMLHRHVVQLATQQATAVQRLLCAMEALSSFARSPHSGVVEEDADLFGKLQSELCKSCGAAAVPNASGDEQTAI
jgi:hypothetical protein